MDVSEVTTKVMDSPAFQTALTALTLLSSMWPKQAHVKDGDCFDFIVVGCGTAGSVIANRLTEVDCFDVLCIEAGGDPPLTAMLPYLFPLAKQDSKHNFKYKSEDDCHSAQNLKDNIVECVSGKMLGGSSSLDWMFHLRGSAEDFDPWVNATCDDGWGWEALQEYFKKSEKLIDEEILKSCEDKANHGTDGLLKVARQVHKETECYLNSFSELGHESVLDLTSTNNMGFAQPLFTADKYRTNNAYAFLTPIKNRCNLHVLKHARVTKIIFEDDVAVGVEVTLENKKCITLKARKEIIVAAGTFNTPQLLMLSGIGPKEHLESLDIKVIADLPVGDGLQDHVCVSMIHRMDESKIPPPPPNPFQFPDPCFIGFVALDKCQNYPDYQTLTAIVPHDSQYQILLFCTIVFGYSDEVCANMYKANIGRNLMYTLISCLHPKSRGQVRLRSACPTDPPLIWTGALNEESDLDDLASYLEDFNRVSNTSYFKSVGAKFVPLDLPECCGLKVESREYWLCYALAMSTTTYQFSSTCPMGEVVDGNLKVIGLKQLRVADASVMPSTISGTLKATVNAIGEKVADLIKKDNRCDNCKKDCHDRKPAARLLQKKKNRLSLM